MTEQNWALDLAGRDNQEEDVPQIKDEFARLAAAGCVRATWHPDTDPDHSWLEQDCFDDVFRQVMMEQIEQEGTWGLVVEYRTTTGVWKEADSCWGFIGQDAHDYTDDLLEAGIRAYYDEVTTNG
jgi:hypothetical protein